MAALRARGRGTTLEDSSLVSLVTSSLLALTPAERGGCHMMRDTVQMIHRMIAGSYAHVCRPSRLLVLFTFLCSCCRGWLCHISLSSSSSIGAPPPTHALTLRKVASTRPPMAPLFLCLVIKHTQVHPPSHRNIGSSPVHAGFTALS